jgi:hypothetical protein
LDSDCRGRCFVVIPAKAGIQDLSDIQIIKAMKHKFLLCVDNEAYEASPRFLASVKLPMQTNNRFVRKKA